jgi:hypothetical protein
MFFRGSRYERVDEAELTAADGRIIRYKRMRFIPENAGTASYIVRQGDRPDLAAYNTVGDPEQFWRLCDVNRVQRPVDLTRTPGLKIQAPGPDSGST